ncbi:uromodulin-like [Ornithodoros turicata]|uniref:uromodulin-like n=1 Tax=Ornithodoros turicata TaxID=34597 RepID=UPI003138D2A2
MNTGDLLGILLACSMVQALRPCTDQELQGGTAVVCHSDALSFLTQCSGACGSGGILRGWYDICVNIEVGERCSKLVQCEPQCNHGHFSEDQHRCVCDPGYFGECCDKRVDVCSSVRVISDNGARSVQSSSSNNCDWFLPPGWYRFDSPAGNRLPETPVPSGSCGTQVALYLDGRHPQPEDDVVVRRVCGAHGNDTCFFKLDLEVKNCGDFVAYKLRPAYICPMAYCLTNAPPPTESPLVSDIGEFRCPRPHGSFEHPQTFRRFIQCSNAKPYVLRCPNYTLFNPIKGICDWPRNLDKKVLDMIKRRHVAVLRGKMDPVQERLSEVSQREQQREQHSVERRVQKVAEKVSVVLNKVYDVVRHNVESAQEGVRCPKQYGVFEYPNDSHKFISCSRSRPSVRECPSGSVFNQKLRKCSWT